MAESLTSWAQYHPASSNPLVCLEINLGKERPADVRSGENTPKGAMGIADRGEQDRVPESDDEQEIGILNSFYISDLELAIRLAARGALPPVLREYLSPK
ncbi:hypothetical protein N6L27_11940 [Leisingera sp. SS27]|uniref:hypothetical protein n=1 Tax=Leisingera sp. SS27 TaxID=2979462 RepID=UPI00232E7AA5|nr:hypothetical protein [Leisingera sp. SS27]MDC0658712.1 hypothetical protein [Leisingera sp. SS27]